MQTVADRIKPASFPMACTPQVNAALPLPLKLVLATLFLPEGMSFFVAGLRLTLTRTIFLVLAPVLVGRLFKRLAEGRYRFVASDLFILLASLWMFIGPAVTDGIGESLTHSGPVVLEYLVGYLCTRLLLERDGQAVAFLSFLCMAICVVVADALLDTLTGRYITREIVAQLTGYSKVWHVADEIRGGLLRAAGPLEHPILLGFTCALGLLIAISVEIRWRPLCIVMCALGLFIALSSASLQSFVEGVALLAYARLMGTLPGRWYALCLLAALALGAMFLFVNSPFGHIIDLATLDPQTGYYRLYIWNAVGPVALDNPYFGVSQEQLDLGYGGSIDSLWLVLAVVYGIPCAVFCFLALIGSCSLPTHPGPARLLPAESRAGTTLGICIVLIVTAGLTVHFWGSVWILTGLLTGLRAHLGELGAVNAAAARPVPRADRAPAYAGRMAAG
jgi:hypothetical protein